MTDGGQRAPGEEAGGGPDPAEERPQILSPWLCRAGVKVLTWERSPAQVLSTKVSEGGADIAFLAQGPGRLLTGPAEGLEGRGGDAGRSHCAWEAGPVVPTAARSGYFTIHKTSCSPMFKK